MTTFGKNGNTLFLFAFIISLFVCIPAPAFCRDDILIITEEWAPYNYSSEGEVTGLSTEIVRALMQSLELDYEIQSVPSARAKALLDHQPHTMMYSMFLTEERESQYKWIGPIADASIYMYKRKDDDLQVNSLEEMMRVGKIACRNTGLIHDLLLNAGFTNLDTTSTESLGIYRKLIAGRCDLAISDTDMGVRYILRKNNIAFEDYLEKVPIPIFLADLYIACSRDFSDSEVAQWNQALMEFKKTDRYDEILRKYY